MFHNNSLTFTPSNFNKTLEDDSFHFPLAFLEPHHIVRCFQISKPRRDDEIQYKKTNALVQLSETLLVLYSTYHVFKVTHIDYVIMNLVTSRLLEEHFCIHVFILVYFLSSYAYHAYPHHHHDYLHHHHGYHYLQLAFEKDK